MTWRNIEWLLSLYCTYILHISDSYSVCLCVSYFMHTLARVRIRYKRNTIAKQQDIKASFQLPSYQTNKHPQCFLSKRGGPKITTSIFFIFFFFKNYF